MSVVTTQHGGFSAGEARVSFAHFHSGSRCASSLEGGANSDPVYRTIQAVRAPGALQERIRAAWVQSGFRAPARVKVIQTHYKPFARARIVARASVPGAASAREQEHFLYINLYPTLEEARAELAQAGAKPLLECLGPPMLLLEDWRTVVWSLPNEPLLSAIRFCFDSEEFASFLAQHGISRAAPLPELVRYVPRKRALFRYQPLDRPALYIKCYEPGADAQAAENLDLAATAARFGSRFDAPQRVLHDPRRHAIGMSELLGVKLTQTIETGAVLAHVGRALAHLHSSSIEPPGLWSPERLIAALRKAMTDMKLALPGISATLDQLVEKIIERRRELDFELTPIHGNLFGDQILIHRGRVSIVDWDDLGMGDPLHDLGRLSAHLIFVARRCGLPRTLGSHHVQLMTNAYQLETGRALDWDRLSWHIAVAMLMRTKISALRTLPPGWATAIHNAIADAGAVLSGNSHWIST